MATLTKSSYNSRSVRLFDELLADLKNGRFAGGELLPPERELAALYGVSRPTLRRTVEQLAVDNHLIKQPQRGVMVPNPRNGTTRHQVSWVTTGHSENVMDYGRGLQNALDPDHYTLATYCSHADLGLYHKLIDKVVAMGAAGIVLHGEGLHHDRKPSHNPRELVRSGIPLVVIGGDDHLNLPCDRVFASRTYTSRKAAEYLIGKNYRDVAMVSLFLPEFRKPMVAELRNMLGPAGIDLPDERIFSFEAPRGWMQPPDPYIDAQEQMARLLAAGFRCGTIIVDHDYPAVGVLRALLAAGIRVPEETQVISMLKCQVEGVSPLRLTTIDHHRYDVGYLAGEILRRRMAGYAGAPEIHHVLAGEVITGETG